MPLETQADFARRLGVARSTVHRHIAAGRLVLVGKRIDVVPSLARLAQTTGTRPDVAARHASARTQPAEAIVAPQVEEGAEGAAGERARYKAAALQAENDQIKLEIALRRGTRLSRAAVGREAAALGAVLRAALERLVDQTAPRLAVITDAAERAALVRAELRHVRRTLRGEFPRALRRLREAAKGPAGGKA